MSKYLSYLYIAGHYAAIALLSLILGFSVISWIVALMSNALIPTLPINVSLIGTVNLVPVLCLIPGVFAAILLTFVPSAKRLLQLELSHRSFRTGMEDVRQAFYIAFSADRNGMFRLNEQFDAVSERIRFLTRYPELQGKEPEILALAAQMSFEARELACRYSTENVTRANAIIAERLAEIEKVETTLSAIERTKAEAKRIIERLAAMQGTAAGQFETDLCELETLLGPYGFVRQSDTETNVVTMVPAAS